MQNKDGLPQAEINQEHYIHWTAKPMGLLVAVLIAKAVLFILQYGIGILVLLIFGKNNTSESAAYILNGLLIIISIFASVLFYRWVTNLQKNKHSGFSFGIQWKPATAFWAGIVLALGYGVLANYEYAQYQPASAVLNFFNSLSTALCDALFLALLLLVLEKRFGIMKGTLAICVSYSLLSIIERLTVQGISTIVTTVFVGDAPPVSLASMLVSMLHSAVASAANTAMLIAAYLIASRRVFGVWPLAFAVNGFLSLLNNAIADALVDHGAVAARSTGLLIDVPFSLAVFALALGIVACFRRWKTLREFMESLRKIQDVD